MIGKDFAADLKEALNETVESVKSKAKEIDTNEIKENIQNTAGAVMDKVSEGSKKATEQIKEILARSNNDESEEASDFSIVSVQSAIKIIYFLMATDGEILYEEEEKFDSIGKELDPDFEHSKEAIISECRTLINVAADASYTETLQEAVDKVLSAKYDSKDTFISSKLLIWDLLVIAYSDGNYDSSEQTLVKYIADKIDLDDAMLMEMESSILTMLDLEKELAWIKTTNKPYLTIDEHVKEIENRKATVSGSIMSLISL